MSQVQTKPTHLPKDPGLRAQLIKRLQQKLQTLTNSGNIENNKSQFEPVNPKVDKNIGILKLRIKLIGDCTELSVERIEHLEQIFKHYCTHIFKIGKHMTFQRLQYEKVHLTLDRLCVFLKDFGLTTAKIGQVQHEIIDKQQIVRNFKRLSKNCRDLSFEEFIACLEKLSGVYYDEKQFYVEKMSRIKQQREARIQEYKKKMKERKRLQAQRKALQSSLNNQNIARNEGNEQAQEKHDKQQGQQNEQNDDLVQKMMQDDKIQNPNDQIQKATNGQAENQFESQVKNKESKIIKKQSIKIEQEYILTVEEKIEYFYQLVGVDNVHDFRKKMSELGLPLFKQYQHSAKPIIHKRSTSTKISTELLNVTVQNGQQQDQRRLIELREKLNIKRERDKHMYSPVISKQEYQERKKRRQQRQAQIMKEMNVSKVGSEQTTARQKQKQKKKIELTDKQLSLDMLNHISFDQLKIKFDPKKYVGIDESDQVYLNQYGVEIDQISSHPRKKQAKSSISKPDIREKTATTLQRKRTSSNIVQDFKKRAYEMQVKQFHKEAELSKFVNDMKKKQKFRNQKL